MTSFPVDAIRWWTPQLTQLLMELGHGFARPIWGMWWVSTPPCQEDGAGVFILDVEYSHPHEEGPLPPAERWLYTLIAPNETITRTRGKLELDDSQGMKMCPQKGGWTIRDAQPQNMDCNRQYCSISHIMWFYSICLIIWFLPFVLIYHYIHLGR